MAINKVSRYHIIDYLDITPNLVTPTYELCGSGFNSLNETPGAQVDKKTYINDTTSTTSVKGYETSFGYDADVMKNQTTVMYLYNVGRNHLVGADAETTYIRADKYDPAITGSTRYFKARKFKVSIEVSGAAGAGGETLVSTGNLNCVGDPIFGYFDTVTKTFVEGEYTETLGTLTVASIAGATSGKTKITVTEPLTSGNVYMYKTASTVTAPILDDDCISYTVWDGVSDIVAVTGNLICIVEVNSQFKAKKTGTQTVTSKA